MSLNRYIGKTVEIIYVDQKDKITQRTIRIKTIEGGTVKAYCLQQRGPRAFVAANILAIQPHKVKSRANSH